MSSERIGMIDRFCDRLKEAAELATEARQSMLRHDFDAIEQATARLRTVGTECRLLSQELQRIPSVDSKSPGLDNAWERLDRTATEVARASAISGGTLHGLVEMTRRLLDAITDSHGESYRRDGRASHAPTDGLHLRGWL